jgi:hypothetical protein
MDIPDDAYDRLMTFVETGAKGSLPEEMIRYVEVLDVIRSMFTKYKSREAIINFLQKPPLNISKYYAAKYFSEAVNFFYLDNEIKKQSWRNWYAEKLDRAADLILKTATCAADLDIYKNMIYAAMDARGLKEPDQNDLPPEMFKKPVKIYVMDPEVLGLKPVNIPEAEKERLRADAMIDGKAQFLPANEEDPGK